MTDLTLDDLTDELYLLADKQIPYAVRLAINRQAYHLSQQIKGESTKGDVPGIKLSGSIRKFFPETKPNPLKFLQRSVSFNKAANLHKPTAEVGTISPRLKLQEEGFTKAKLPRYNAIPIRLKAGISATGNVPARFRLSRIGTPLELKGNFKSDASANVSTLAAAFTGKKKQPVNVLLRKGSKRGIFQVKGKMLARKKRLSKGLPYKLTSIKFLYNEYPTPTITAPHKWFDAAIEASSNAREEIFIEAFKLAINTQRIRKGLTAKY